MRETAARPVEILRKKLQTKRLLLQRLPGRATPKAFPGYTENEPPEKINHAPIMLIEPFVHGFDTIQHGCQPGQAVRRKRTGSNRETVPENAGPPDEFRITYPGRYCKKREDN